MKMVFPTCPNTFRCLAKQSDKIIIDIQDLNDFIESSSFHLDLRLGTKKLPNPGRRILFNVSPTIMVILPMKSKYIHQKLITVASLPSFYNN